jgi:branched-chain amino acid transport system permease protein
VTAATFAAAGALAGLAGLLVSPLSYASPWLGLDYAIEGFAAAIIGGLGSWRGAVLGGLLLGMSRSLILTYVSPTWGSFVTLSLILLVLYLRPTGLFGEWQSMTQGTR